MKAETIADALNELDDAILSEAISVRQPRPKRHMPKAFGILAAAACLGILLFGAGSSGIIKLSIPEQDDVATGDEAQDSGNTADTDMDADADTDERQKFIQSLTFLSEQDVAHISRIDYHMNSSNQRYIVSDPEVIRTIGTAITDICCQEQKTNIGHASENTLNVTLVMDNGVMKRFACDEDYVYIAEYAIQTDIYSLLTANGVLSEQ